MKNKVIIFVCVALVALTVVPAINLTLINNQQNAVEKWWSKSVLYNFDFALPYLSCFFYPLGISTNPNQVIIGKNNWLYLGDQYEKTISVKRRIATEEDLKTAREIARQSEAWKQFLRRKGVRLYKVMIGPDKGTVYPEFLPDWVRPVAGSATDALLANVTREIYIDTRPKLINAKSQFAEPLYYKTGTHWNSLGAWVAFRAFCMDVARTETDLRWLSERQVRVLKANKRYGSDLAYFLRMTEILRDTEVKIEILSKYPVETEQFDFETGQLKVSDGNPEIGAIGNLKRPLLVKSQYALNERKVLWLRDSFGAALSPFMAATFTETLQIHYSEIDSKSMVRLIDTYKPDYVFITVVERGARGEWFKNPPPMAVTSKKPVNFVALSQWPQYGTNDMINR